MYVDKKPIKRTSLRRRVGRIYYTYKRYLKWYITNERVCKISKNEEFPNIIFEHKTPLFRKLKDVDVKLQHNKVVNLNIAIDRINGVIINPGETFSYWRLIGNPTSKKGYKDGVILCPDGSFKPGVGGGLCQLSNLIYWMTIHSRLDVIERYRHSHDVFPDVERKIPFGSGATCVYNYLDLRIKNNTEHSYQFIFYMDDEFLCGKILCSSSEIYRYDIYEKEHWITKGFWGGYIRHNTIYRKRFNKFDELLEDEKLCENHAIMMYEPLLEGEKCNEDKVKE